MEIPISIDELRERDEIDIVRYCILGESEGECIIGKIAVACVIRNRANDPRWPDNYIDVCLQDSQFSCFNPKQQRKSMFISHWAKEWWREAQFVAWGLLNKYFGDITRGANHYHAVGSNPYWAEGKDPCARIGNHIFYKL